MITNGYAIITSQDLDVNLVAYSDSQVLLTEHVLLETNIVQEHIPVIYQFGDKQYRKSILLQKQGSQPFVDVQLIERKEIEFGETVKLQLKTNVPKRVVTDLTVNINGQPLDINDDYTFEYNAFNQRSVIDVSMSLMNIQAPVTTTKTLKHEYDVDMGCEVVKRSDRLYALCFTNTNGAQRIEFFLGDQRLSTTGDIAFFPENLSATELHYHVGNKTKKYRILKVDDGFVTNLIM
jgi:ribosomal protein L36